MICLLPRREADSRWIGELWQNYLDTVAANRQIPAQQVFPGAQAMLDGLTKVDGDTAKYALDNKLVDALASSAEVEKMLTKQFGWSKADKNYRAVSYYDYSLKTPADTGDSIGVIFANGAIMDGEETPGNVGGDTTAGTNPRSASRSESESYCSAREQSMAAASAPRKSFVLSWLRQKRRVNRLSCPWAAWRPPVATGSPPQPVTLWRTPAL